VPAGAKVSPSSTTRQCGTQQYRFFAAATTSLRYLRYNRVANNGGETARLSADRAPAIARLGADVVVTPTVPGNKSSPSFEEDDIAIETVVASRISRRPSKTVATVPRVHEKKADRARKPIRRGNRKAARPCLSSTIVGRRQRSCVD